MSTSKRKLHFWGLYVASCSSYLYALKFQMTCRCHMTRKWLDSREFPQKWILPLSFAARSFKRPKNSAWRLQFCHEICYLARLLLAFVAPCVQITCSINQSDGPSSELTIPPATNMSNIVHPHLVALLHFDDADSPALSSGLLPELSPSRNSRGNAEGNIASAIQVLSALPRAYI